jgi:hypothetical protein
MLYPSVGYCYILINKKSPFGHVTATWSANMG